MSGELGSQANHAATWFLMAIGTALCVSTVATNLSGDVSTAMIGLLARLTGANKVAAPLPSSIVHVVGTTPFLLHHCSVHWGHGLSHGGQRITYTGTVPVLPSSCLPYVFQYSPLSMYQCVDLLGVLVC